ncbi:hypothetical protein QA612_15885 [Evansella sp. AB-P1]|uniref:hypothetical protein n=1 Tax=Evansella sp. AB-P1 TaxID=3037653 RepID=UPI00241EF820|nr:hypothetical protein [Evansella sp. AB-P1]MDG5788937.1 hypothetical protein [Evansella sp. AB-P1]
MQQQNMTQGQGQQNVMPEPPNVITTKDHMYVTDMLSWNLLAMKKAHAYAQQCTDPQISQALDEAGRMHNNHYQTILNHLNQQNQQMNKPLQ